MFENSPIKNNHQHSKQSQNSSTVQLAKIIGNQAIIQFEKHHVIPKALFQKYRHALNGFDENTTVEIDDHSGSHPEYSDAVATALEYCIKNQIDCGRFAFTLADHLKGLNSIKNIDYTYLFANVISLLTSAPASYQSSSGTTHTRVTPFDPSPLPPPPTSSFGRRLKPRQFD